eukprot:gene12642-15877_t
MRHSVDLVAEILGPLIRNGSCAGPAVMARLLSSTCITLLGLLLLPLHSAQADCSDAYWDCFKVAPAGSSLIPSGGFTYGTCFAWATKNCLACNPKDQTDASWILAKCNSVAPVECAGQCVWYADIMGGCCADGQRCGNLTPEMKNQVCPTPGLSRGEEQAFIEGHRWSGAVLMGGAVGT